MPLNDKGKTRAVRGPGRGMSMPGPTSKLEARPRLKPRSGQKPRAHDRPARLQIMTPWHILSLTYIIKRKEKNVCYNVDLSCSTTSPLISPCMRGHGF